MLMVTSGVFLLILAENKDTKGMEFYLKAYAWAEGALEMALLNAKNHSYSYSTTAPPDKGSDFSRVLTRNPDNQDSYHPKKDVLVGYKIDATTQTIEKKYIAAWFFDIIPLFSMNEAKEPNKVSTIELKTLGNANIVWNIVGNNEGMSGTWDINLSTRWNLKRLTGGNPNYSEMLVSSFLKQSNGNYLIIHNVSTNSGTYTLSTPNSGEYFTREKNVIIASGEIGDYKQNIQFDLDTSQYLNLLKYSIFSQ